MVLSAGLLGSVFFGGTYSKINAQGERAGQSSSEKEEEPFTNEYGQLSSDPEISLELTCDEPHMFDEYKKWSGRHIAIKASYLQLKSESVFWTVGDDEETIVPPSAWMISRDRGKPTNIARVILTSHGFITGGEIFGRVDENGKGIPADFWMKPDRPIRFSLYQSEDGLARGRIVAQVEKSISCPGAVTDKSGLEDV